MDWQSLSGSALVEQTGYVSGNAFRPARKVDRRTADRLGEMLRDRLQQYEEAQAESRRISKERHQAEKLKSERVKHDVEENRIRNERRKELGATKPIGLEPVPAEKHDKFFATISVADPKYKQPDRAVYGVTMADGASYRYLDDKQQTLLTCSKLRPDCSSPGRDSYSMGKELRNLTLGDNVHFLEHKTGDNEFFRLNRQDSFGVTPPPGAYYLGHGEEHFHESSSYLRKNLPGRKGLPRMGKDTRVIIGPRYDASWVNVRETEYVPAPHHYHNKDQTFRGDASYARQAAEPDPSRLKPPMPLGFTIAEASRGMLLSEAEVKAKREARAEALKEFCRFGHPTEAPSSESQAALDARLKLQAEQRWKLTPKDPFARPSSPLPESAFYRQDKIKAAAEA